MGKQRNNSRIGKQQHQDKARKFEIEARQKYAIQKIPTEKDQIKHPQAAEDYIIPKLCTSMLFVGKSGSGKSTLLHNLLMRKEFYDKHKSFDQIYLISPTAETDDIQKSLNLPPDHIETDMDKAAAFITGICSVMRDVVKKQGAALAPKVLFILDDVISHTKLMSDPAFIALFTLLRHFNATTMLCTQHFNKVPRVCRMQANTLFFFALNNGEMDILFDEFAPPHMSRKDFMMLCDYALAMPNNFLKIDMKRPWEERFTHNLSDNINLDYFRGITARQKSRIAH